MTIPKLTPYTGQVANPDGSQTQTEFTQNMFGQLSYEAQLATELDATVDGMNQAVTEVENSAAAASASAAAAEASASTAGYQGLWPDTGGSANKGDTYQTQVGGTPTGEYFTALQNTTVDPVGDNVNWKRQIDEEYSKESEERLLGAGSSLYKGSNGVYVQNGDSVPTETTHIVVLFSGETNLVELSPVSSGTVSALSEYGATIGSSKVRFIGNGRVPIIYGKDIGIVGDGVADDSDALELGLNFFGNIDTASVFQKNVSYILDLTGLKVRYTRKLVQSQGCQIKGDFLQALRVIDINNDKGTILYPDFNSPLQSSIVTACYSLNDSFAPEGTLIDPWDYKVDSVTYDDGRVTRSYGCSIEGVGFYTDKFVGSPYGAAAAPSVKAEYVHSGFLNAGLFTGCWPCDVKVYGNSYHRGVVMYNCNDRTIDGYISRYSDVSAAPVLDDTTDPALVIAAHTTHNPDSLRHNTCGVYEAYCNAGEVNATIEKFETSKFRWACLGTVENSPYIENAPVLMYHHVGSVTLVKAPRFGFAGSLGRVSSGGILDIELPAIQQGTIVKLDYGSQISSGAPARMHFTLQGQSDIPDGESYNSAVSFSFVVPPTTIYVDSTNGNNTNTGLTLANAVQSLDIALARAEYYNIENIELINGDTAELSADYLLTSKIRIYPESGQATVTPVMSGGFMRRIQLGSNADVIIEDCAVFLPSGGTSASARGLFRPVEGSSKVSLLNCDTSSGDSYPGLFNSVSGSGTYTTFNISGGSVSLEHYGRNDFSANGQATIVLSKSGVAESGALNWGSTFKVL